LFSDSQVQERLYVLADAPPTLPTSHTCCGTSSSICALSSSNGPLSSSSVAGRLADHAPDHAPDHPPWRPGRAARVVERRATCGVTSGVERPAAGRSSGGRSRSGNHGGRAAGSGGPWRPSRGRLATKCSRPGRSAGGPWRACCRRGGRREAAKRASAKRAERADAKRDRF